MKSLLFLFAAYCTFLCNASNGVKSYEQLIREDLMENYDRISRPVGNMSEPVTVTIEPMLFSILDVDVAEQTLSLKQWFAMTWKDKNLQWDPSLYGGVDSIMVQRSTIWLPDVVILGEISVSAISDKLSLAEVSSDGTVYYSSNQVATVSCLFDVVDFPYDTQNCSIKYSSWMYSSQHITLNNAEIDAALLAFYIENDEWTMRSYTNRSEIYDGASTVSYDIMITRKPSYYITTFIWPTFLINCLSIIGIYSPFNESGEREEKVTMGLTTLLTMAVILMIIAGDMPRSADGIPLLGVFMMVEIGLAGVATVFSVFVTHLHSNWMNGTPVSHWLLKFTCLATLKRKAFNVNEQRSISSTNTQQWQHKEQTEHEFKGVQTINPCRDIGKNNSESLREKWSRVAGRIDLILMVIFLIANFFVCVSLLAIGNSKLNK